MCGIQNTKIQQRLLSEIDLSFEKALKISISMERAEKNVLDIKKRHEGIS